MLLEHPKSNAWRFKISSDSNADIEAGATSLSIQIQLPTHFTKKRFLPLLILTVVSGVTGYGIANLQQLDLIEAPSVLVSKAQIISEANATVNTLPFNLEKKLNTNKLAIYQDLNQVSYELTLARNLNFSMSVGALQQAHTLMQATLKNKTQPTTEPVLVAKLDSKTVSIADTANSLNTKAALNHPEHTKQALLEASPKVPTEAKASIFKKMTIEQQSAHQYQQAITYLQQGRVAEAQDMLKKTLASNPANHDARQTLVGVLLDNRHLDEAAQVLKEGIETSPTQTAYTQTLARLQLDAGFAEQALSTLEAGATYAQDDSHYQALMAVVLQRLSKHNDAIFHFQQALSQGANTPAWLIGMGISLQIVGRGLEAKEAFEQAQQQALNPELALFVAERIKQVQ